MTTSATLYCTACLLTRSHLLPAFFNTFKADKLDPKEQAKQESREWINDMVDRLQVRVEQFECDVEEMQAGLKKKAKPPPKLVQVRGPAGTAGGRWVR